MPRRRPQPDTPPSLPPLPAGAYKKAYYPYPDTVYYLADESDTEWTRGTVSNETKSTSLHIVSTAYPDDVNDY
ncbi:hypothetical protein N7505_007216 [Penicillium chrysogenum]|uniref:Uncharacterized protein n=1 Tax=Penicillium chrysogenum TaxID=5076 RepID=A0ABQ8WCR7_PENCH|nr:hypothetical protein N7505_007216 [Penicillium chrysogenum]